MKVSVHKGRENLEFWFHQERLPEVSVSAEPFPSFQFVFISVLVMQ